MVYSCHIFIIGFLLTFTFPLTAQNIVVRALLYVFFVLFYFLCKHIIIEKKEKKLSEA